MTADIWGQLMANNLKQAEIERQKQAISGGLQALFPQQVPFIDESKTMGTMDDPLYAMTQYDPMMFVKNLKGIDPTRADAVAGAYVADQTGSNEFGKALLSQFFPNQEHQQLPASPIQQYDYFRPIMKAAKESKGGVWSAADDKALVDTIWKTMKPVNMGGYTGAFHSGTGGITNSGDMTLPPQETSQHKQSVAEATALGTGYGTRKIEEPQKLAALESLNQRTNLVKETVNRMIRDEVSPWSTGVAANLGYLPWDTQAGRLKNSEDSLKGLLGLTELQNLKATGTSLGQVAIPEHAYLQGLWGQLDATRGDPKRYQMVLKQIEKAIDTSNERMAKDFKRLYGYYPKQEDLTVESAFRLEREHPELRGAVKESDGNWYIYKPHPTDPTKRLRAKVR